MEQQAAQYWMWMKRKHIMKTRIQASMMMKPYDSWEEQAFAEDAAGPLGGCIWPPRSYSCSFCRREFRSAQALGGHMNVHRRDRARLKQSSLSPQNESDHHDKNNPCNKSSSTQFPSDQFCSTLDYNHYPNCSTSTSPSLIASSPLSISRVSASSTLDNFSKHTFLSPYSEPTPYDLCTPFGSNNSDKYITKKEEILSTDLSMGMNLVVRRNQPTGSDGDEVISCKRHKNFDNPFPFNPKPCLKLSSMEELDLELRLGDPPKIK